MCCQDNSPVQLLICSSRLCTIQHQPVSKLQLLCGICGNKDFKISCVCAYITTVQNALVNRGDTSQDVLNDTSTLLSFLKLCVCLWVRLCSRVVWDSLVGGQLVVCVWRSKRGGGAQRRQALSIIHPTCHQGNPPKGGQASVRTSGNL